MMSGNSLFAEHERRVEFSNRNASRDEEGQLTSRVRPIQAEVERHFHQGMCNVQMSISASGKKNNHTIVTNRSFSGWERNFPRRESARRGESRVVEREPDEEDPQWDSRGSEGRVIQNGVFSRRFSLIGCEA